MLYINDDIAGFDFDAALPLLSEQRRQQALSFKHEQGRKTCAAAYLLLREGLRREYGITEAPLFEYGEYGKPHLVGYPSASATAAKLYYVSSVICRSVLTLSP